MVHGINDTLNGRGWELFRHEGEPGKAADLDRLMQEHSEVPTVKEIGEQLDLYSGKYTLFYNGEPVQTDWYRG